MNRAGLNLQARLTDSFAHSKTLLDEAVKHGVTDVKEKLQVLLNLNSTDRIHQLVQGVANYGTLKLKTIDGSKVWTNEEGSSYSKAAEIVGDDPRFAAYLRAKNALANNLANGADNRAIVAAGDRIPEFVEAQKHVAAVNRSLVQALVDSGRLSKEEAATWKPDTYTPTYSVDKGEVYLDGGAGKSFRIGSVKDLPKIHELIGGAREQMPLWEAHVRNAEILTRIAVNNYAAKSIGFLARDLKLGKLRSSTDNSNGNVLSFYVDGKRMSVKMDRDAGIERAEKSLAKATTPAEREQAKKVLALLNDTSYISLPDLISNLGGMPMQVPSLIKFLSYPRQLLHGMITRNPLYPLRQFPRDVTNTFVLSGGDVKVLKNVFSTMAKVVTDRDTNAKFLKEAGAGESNILHGDSTDMGRMLSKIGATSGGLTGILNSARFGLDKWATSGDMTNRSMLMESGLRAGMTRPEAMLYAIDAGTNFSRRGNSTTLYWANQLTPFLNSQLRGLDLAIRAVRGQAPGQEKTQAFQKLLVRGGIMMATSALYHAMVSDEDWYNNLSPEVRANNIPIKIGDRVFLQAVPFEAGSMFITLPTAVMTALKDKHGLGTHDFGKMMRTMVMGNLPGGGVPIGDYGFVPTAGIPGTMINTAMSVYGNFSPSTGNPIVPTSKQGLDPSEQFTTHTSSAAKAMGEAVGISPMKADAAMRGLVSTMGVARASILADAVHTPKKDYEEPTTDIRDSLFLRSMFAPTDSHAVLNSLMDTTTRKPVQAEKTFKEILNKQLDPEKAKAYAADNPEFAFADTARQLQKNVSDTQTLITQITNMRGKTGEWKREQLDKLQQNLTEQGHQHAIVKQRMDEMVSRLKEARP